MNLSRFQRDHDPIDEGTFGIALKAFDTVETRDVCLKMIKAELLDEYKDFIFREIEMLGQLNHPNIVKYYGHFSEKEKLYIVLEYVEGGDLKSYLKKNKPPLSEEIVLSFLSQLVSGLSYAHSLKIIHRDLKPANILLTKDDKIKIIDFNSAKMVQTLCPTSDTLAGTPGYVPLEILTLEGHSFPADVFSLGCVIYELMTGKPPFYHKDIIELGKMLETQKPLSIEENYSCILKYIVMKMLEKNPNERITLKEMQSFLLQDQIYQLHVEKQNLEEQNLQLLNSVNQFQVYSDYLEREKSQFQSKIQTVERENSQLQTEKQHLERENFQLQTEKQNLKNENSTFQNKIQELSNFKKSISDEIVNFSGKNSFNDFNESKYLSFAMKIFKFSADFWDSNAMFNYGFGLEKGLLGTVDKKGAMEYYKIAADLGNSDAMFGYGNGLENGYLGTIDKKAAMEYYKKASDLGNSGAMFNYGNGLENGYLGTIDKKGAMEYYKKAAGLGNPVAMFNYGRNGLKDGCHSE